MMWRSTATVAFDGVAAVVVVIAVVTVGLVGVDRPAYAQDTPAEAHLVDDPPFTPPDPFNPMPAHDPPAAPGERLPPGWAGPSDVVVRYERPAAGRVRARSNARRPTSGRDIGASTWPCRRVRR